MIDEIVQVVEIVEETLNVRIEFCLIYSSISPANQAPMLAIVHPSLFPLYTALGNHRMLPKLPQREYLSFIISLISSILLQKVLTNLIADCTN
jgi:hypothetical protein